MAFTDISTRRTLAKPAARRLPAFATFFDVWRSRRALARLDAHALDDIGLNAERASRESAKPIWDVPATWRD